MFCGNYRFHKKWKLILIILIVASMIGGIVFYRSVFLKTSTAYLLKSVTLDNEGQFNFEYDGFNLKKISASYSEDGSNFEDSISVETEIYENQIQLICTYNENTKTFVYEFDEENELKYFKDEEGNLRYIFDKNKQDAADILSQVYSASFGEKMTFEYVSNTDQQIALNGINSSGEDAFLLVINESEEMLSISTADDWNDWNEDDYWMEFKFEKVKIPAGTSELLKSLYSKPYYHMFDWYEITAGF